MELCVHRTQTLHMANVLFGRINPSSFYITHTSVHGSASSIAVGVFKKDGESDTFATREADVYCLCITTFMIKEIEDIVSWAFSCKEFMISSSTRARNGLRVMYSSLVLLFIMLHETGHFNLGHCDFFGLGRENNTLLKHIDDGLFSDKIPLDVMAISAELEADKFAVSAIYSDKALKAIDRECLIANITYLNKIGFITSAVCMAFLYLCFSERRKGIRGTLFSNLPAGCRAIRFINHIRAGRLADTAVEDAVALSAQDGVRTIDLIANKIPAFGELHKRLILDYATYGAALEHSDKASLLFGTQLQSFRIILPRKSSGKLQPLTETIKRWRQKLYLA
jgi:hypothetical protein